MNKIAIFINPGNAPRITILIPKGRGKGSGFNLIAIISVNHFLTLRYSEILQTRGGKFALENSLPMKLLLFSLLTIRLVFRRAGRYIHMSSVFSG